MKYSLINTIAFLLLALLLMPANATIKSGSMTPAGAAPKDAQIVTVGFFPISMNSLDIMSNTVHIDTYIWMKWKGDIEPTESMELINAVDRSNLVKDFLLKEPGVMSDGSKYQIMHIEGTFSEKFILSDFPFDKQSLRILIEDGTHGFQEVTYLIDQASSGIGDQLDVPGWNIKGWSSQTYIHDYGTSFGETEHIGGGSAYSVAAFEINIDRPPSYFIWKLLLPLVIVIAGAWVSLILDPSHIETRTGMPATALLTTVFLQQGYTQNLPSVGYLVMMDKIYVLAYILIIITLIRSIAISFFKDKETGAINEVRVKINDKIMLLLQVMIFFFYIFWVTP